MTQLVASDHDKYLHLQLNSCTKFDVIPEMPRLLQLETNGCSSPLILHFTHLKTEEHEHFDLGCYLSTREKQPSISNCMQQAQNRKVVKFYGKMKNFYRDDVLYICLKSEQGCTV